MNDRYTLQFHISADQITAYEISKENGQTEFCWRPTHQALVELVNKYNRLNNI